MDLDELIKKISGKPMPTFPVRYSNRGAMAGPNFVPYHVEAARTGNPYALQRLREFWGYLEKQKLVEKQ